MNSKAESDHESELKSSFPVFNCLSREGLRELASIISWFDTNKGNSLFQQGAPGLGVYLLFEGEVEQHHLTTQGKNWFSNYQVPER